MTTYQELTEVERLTSQRDQARRDRDRFAQVIEYRVKELDEARAAVQEALASLAASDAAMEMATAELLAKDATIERVRAVLDDAEDRRDWITFANLRDALEQS